MRLPADSQITREFAAHGYALFFSSRSVYNLTASFDVLLGFAQTSLSDPRRPHRLTLSLYPCTNPQSRIRCTLVHPAPTMIRTICCPSYAQSDPTTDTRRATH